MDFTQPEPYRKKYTNLISELENGTIQIPKFQRDFVWSIEQTAELLDSILKGYPKGYPIGTFILWETDERLNHVKQIGDLSLAPIPEGKKVEYVLDGQQRIASLYAAYKGATITKSGGKKATDYKNIFVNLDKNAQESDEQIITTESVNGKSISLHQVLHFDYINSTKLTDFSDAEKYTIDKYRHAFQTYEFSTIVLRKEGIDSAIEVFTRINTGGKKLGLFEIMSAKTYDESQGFDMQARWDKLDKKLVNYGYGEISNTVILYLLSFLISSTKECKTKTILALDKQKIINEWDAAISALEESIEYFRTVYRIPVSRLLPYDILLVPFSYFFYCKKDQPDYKQSKLLEQYFWCASLSFRYSGSTQTDLAQDIRQVDKILNNDHPEYKDMKDKIRIEPESLIDTPFRTGSSYCKAVLCLLAYKKPLDFKDNRDVPLDNSYLKIATSKNYHHFFPKSFLGKKNIPNENSLINITLVSDRLNKREIGSKPPSEYIGKFKRENPHIDHTLGTHFIQLDGFGIENDDYETFLDSRAELISKALKSRINLDLDE